MNNHPYLRAYMAGIAVPTMFLLVALTGFCIARFVYQVPAPIERVIVFPLAIIPNVFGAWNMLHLALRSKLRLPLGIHGAILPFILAPTGFIFALSLGILNTTGSGLVYFGLVTVSYAHLAIIFPVAVVIYYLVWKYLIGFLNALVGVAQ